MTQTVPVEALRPSAFDAERPPEKELLDDCVHCGFCLPACPTYVLWGNEMDSPRGRIYLIDRASAGEVDLNRTFQAHMDNCLGCMACMTACPSGVQYDKLIEDTRGQVERHTPRTAGERLFRELLFQLFPHPNRLRVLALPLLLYQRSGLRRLLQASGLLSLLPKRLRALEALCPPVPANLFGRLPAAVCPERPRVRVGLLSGCVQQVFFPHVNLATIRVLTGEGCEVVVPRGQGCCGALMLHCGRTREGAERAKQMIEAFEAANVDLIAINAAGCGSAMKGYAHLLRGEPGWEARAEAFSARCRDVSELLSELPPQSELHPLPMRVAYHDACHLRHAQGVHEEPRALLGRIPGLEIAEIEEPGLCCGSAGVYNLLHPETASQLGDRKVGHLLSAGAAAVVSANPGCLLQLMSGLRRRSAADLPAFHLVELLDASMRNLSPAEMLGSSPSES